MCLEVNHINVSLSHLKQSTNHFVLMPKLIQSNLPSSQVIDLNLRFLSFPSASCFKWSNRGGERVTDNPTGV